MKTKQQIMSAAEEIAGCSWEDIYSKMAGTLETRLRLAAIHVNHGSDGDFTDEDRAALRKLASDAKEAGL